MPLVQVWETPAGEPVGIPLVQYVPETNCTVYRSGFDPAHRVEVQELVEARSFFYPLLLVDVMC